MEGGNQRSASQRKEPDKIGIPDLALTMQAMSLSEPGLCRIQDNQEIKQEQLDFSCSLIMKVANTGGSSRSLSQKSVEDAMTRAWKDKYHGISQVSSSVFLAHFKSQEDMVSIYIKQPWIANSENLLVDWFDSSMNATSSSDFRFDSILVTVRAYGIPRNKRSISLLKNILNQVGEVSDFHILQETNLFAKQDYIWGTAKLKVDNPIKDRAALSFNDNSSAISYLHYEKIKRICLFCGIMFHNTQDCKLRNNLISERLRNRQSSADIPEQRYGQWVVDENLIPTDLIQSARMGDQDTSQGGNVILQRLRQMFAEDLKGKSKVMENHSLLPAQLRIQDNQKSPAVRDNYQDVLRSSNYEVSTEHQHKKEGRLLLTGDTGQDDRHNISPQDSTQPVINTIAEQHKGQNSTHQGRAQPNESENTETGFESTYIHVNPTPRPSQPINIYQNPATGTVFLDSVERPSNAKRAAPSLEEQNQPSAKKPMASHGSHMYMQDLNTQIANSESQLRPSIPECVKRDTPCFNTSLPLAQNADLMNKALNIQIMTDGTGILGAAPTSPSFFNATQINKFDSKARTKASRWDMQTRQQSPMQYTQRPSVFMPGANTWKRNKTAANARKVHQVQKPGTIAASPCRSDATSAIECSYNHDPWPLHAPTASASQGTLDSRLGAFSPPQMTRDLYEASNLHTGTSHQAVHENQELQMVTMQQGVTQIFLNQSQEARIAEAQNDQAEAPALKAPQAP